MDNSLRDAMMQMVSLQAQSLNAINNLTTTVQNGASSGAVPSPSSLTSYMNYSAPYYGPPNPFAPTPQAAARFGNYASQLAPNGFGDAAKQYIMSNPSQISQEQRNMLGANIGAGISNATIAGAGAVASGAGTLAGYALMPGFIGGAVAGGVVGGLAGAVTSVALDQAQQSQAINKYLLQNSYRFINPMESRNDRGVGGFNQGERWQAATMLRNFDVKANISDEQTMQLLQGFTEGGLLKSASDLKTFEKKFSQLTQYVKQAAITMNASFTETTQVMAELEKRGLLSQNFDYFSAGSKILGSVTGQSAMQAMQSTMGLAGTMAQPGSSTSYQSSAFQAQQYLNIFGIMEDTSKRNMGTDQGAADLFNTMRNMGGRDAMAQTLVNSSRSTWGSRQDLQFAWAALATDTEGKSFSNDAFLNAVRTSGSLEELNKKARARYDKLGLSRNWDIITRRAESEFMQQDSLAAEAAWYELMDPNLNLSDTLLRYSGKSYGEVIGLSGYVQANTPEARANFDRYTKQQNALAARNANVLGIGGVINNFGRSIGNAVGIMTDPLVRGTAALGQSLADTIGGVKVENLTLSNQSYDSYSISSLGQQATKQLADIGLGASTTKQYSGYTVQDPTSLTEMGTRIDQKMAEMEASGKTGSVEYKRYADAKSTYDKMSASAQGFIEAGSIIAGGYGSDGGFLSGIRGAKDKAGFNFKYKNMNWADMTPEQIAAWQKKGIREIAGDLTHIAGDKKKIDAFLDQTNIASIAGVDRSTYANLLMKETTADGLVKVVERMMKDINANSGGPMQGEKKQGEGQDMSIQANNIYVSGAYSFGNSSGFNNGFSGTGGVGISPAPYTRNGV